MPFSVVTRRLVLSRRVAIAVALLLSVAVGALAQVRFGDFGRFGGRRRPFTPLPNVGYDGRFTFVRVSYETAPGGYWWRGQPSWSHGYPIAEQNLMKIMNEVSYLDAHDAEINTLTLDDPELFKYPVAYIIEVSWWTLTDPEAAALRTYMQKGGFVIVDDFKAYGDFGSPGWEVFEANMKRVLPEARFFEMQASHPIFHCFFEINDLDIIPQAYNAGTAGLPRRLRGQRSVQAADDDRQLQHRRFAVLGMVGHRAAADRRHERSLQAGRELHHLWFDTLVGRTGRAPSARVGSNRSRAFGARWVGWVGPSARGLGGLVRGGFMRHRTRLVVHVGAVVVALTASLLGQQAPVGYDDTPKQPDGRWRIHDGARPHPRIVKPGTAGAMSPASAPQDAVVLVGAGDDRSAWQMMDGSPVTWAMKQRRARDGEGPDSDQGGVHGRPAARRVRDTWRREGR